MCNSVHVIFFKYTHENRKDFVCNPSSHSLLFLIEKLKNIQILSEAPLFLFCYFNIKNINENDLFNQLTEYCKLYKSEIKSDKKDKIKKSLTFLKYKAKTLEIYLIMDNTF